MNRHETQALLTLDTIETLVNTWNEYTDDLPLPTADRSYLIEKILDLMTLAGDIEDPPSFKLADLAREMGINPTVARDKLRKGDPPQTIGSGWVFATVDREAVINIIKRRHR